MMEWEASSKQKHETSMEPLVAHAV
jgi:hypothetical protein